MYNLDDVRRKHGFPTLNESSKKKKYDLDDVRRKHGFPTVNTSTDETGRAKEPGQTVDSAPVLVSSPISSPLTRFRKTEINTPGISTADRQNAGRVFGRYDDLYTRLLSDSYDSELGRFSLSNSQRQNVFTALDRLGKEFGEGTEWDDNYRGIADDYISGFNRMLDDSTVKFEDSYTARNLEKANEERRNALYSEWMNLNRQELETGVYGDRTASDVWDEYQRLDDEHKRNMAAEGEKWLGNRFQNLSDQDRKLVDDVVDFYYYQGQTHSFLDRDENRRARDSYNQAISALYKKYGSEQADAFIQTRTRERNAERAAGRTERFNEAADKHVFLSSVGAALTNIPGSIAAAADIAGQAIYNPAGYRTLDVNTQGMDLQNYTRATIDRVSQNVEARGGKVASWAYQLGMSFLDSAAAMVSGTGGFLALSAATNTMQDITERGGDMEQAIAGGIVSGVAEAVFERFSIEQFEQLTQKDIVRTAKDWLENIGKSMLTNASEEMFTEAANIISDSIIMSDLSQYAETVRRLMAENPGMSESEAKARAAGQLGLQILESGLSGAVMGAVFGTVGSAVSAGRTAVQDRAPQTVETVEQEKTAPTVDRKTNMSKDGNMLLGAAYNAYREANPDTAVSENEYSMEFEIAYEYGKSGADLETTRKSDAIRNLSAATIEAAHSAGRQAARAALGENANVPTTQTAETSTQEAAPDIETVKIRNVPKTVREQIVRDYTEAGDEVSAADYAGAAAMAYNYGEAGLRIDDVTAENEGASSELIRKYYDMGAAARSAELERAKIKNASFRAANPKGVSGQVRSITAEESGKYGVGTITRRTFTKRQKAAIQVANSLAKDLGINIVLYESKVGKGGVRQGDNGFYANRTLYLDIESGYNNEQAMLRTLSHEVTHYLEDAAPEQYESLRQFVTDYFYESGELSDLIVREQQLASRNGETLTENEAMLEVVANACETMLRDTEAMRAMLQHNKSLFRTIRGWIDDFAKAVRRAWQGISAYEEAAKSLERSEKALREVSRLWYEALAESAVGSNIMSANGAEATLDAAGIQFDADSESVIMRSRRYAPQNEEEIEKVASALQKKLGVTRVEAVRWIESETTLAATILSLQDEQLDYEADELYSAIKNNADYPQGTVDFSNLCRKRREFTAYFDRLQKNFPNHVFTPEEIETIRQVMIRKNIEVACGLCFVEERRQQLGKIANDFIEGLKNGGLKPAVVKALGAEDNYVPTIDELITYDGLATLRKTHPSVANAFVVHNNARGMQAGRLIEGAAEYDRQIQKWNARKVERVNSLGGLRIFSFSDFEAPYLIDIVQIIQDCAVKGVKMQGYTKVPAFAKAVKDTGLKVNRSHIALGSGVETRNGKRVLVNDPVEGIDFNDPDFFDSSDSPNIGNNIVGISDEHIRLAMEDPYYDQVIPLHTSLSNDILTRKKINHWKNYKNYQTEKIADGFSAEDSKTWKRAEQGVNFYTDVLLAAEQEGKPITNKVEFVERFLAVCLERGVIPRFWNFLNTDANGNFIYTEGYHKLLVDYKLFDRDGNILPQEVVKPVFDDAYNTKILEDYSKGYQKPGADDAVYQELVQELGLEGETVRRSRRDPYAVSDREALANAYESVAVNEAEADALKRYRDHFEKLESLEQQLAEINEKLRQQFVAGGERLSRAEVSKLSENKKTIQNQIARQDRVLLNFERSAALKRVLEVAKKTATDKVKAKAREDARAYRERIRAEREAGAENLREFKAKTRESRKKAEYKARVMDLTRELTSWIVRPDNKRHVPTMLIEPIGKFLESIDLSSKALLAGKSVTQRDSRFRQALYALRDAVSGEGDHKEDVFALDISPEFTDYLRALQGAAEQIAERESGTFVVEQMTGDQLETLYKVLRELRRVVTAANQTLTISQYENIDRLARETMAELEAMGKKKDQANAVRAVDAFFQWENTTPVYAFDRFGKPGRAVFESLQNAQSQLASDAEEIIDFAEKAYTAKEVREWQRETHEIKRGGETVTVTTEQLMVLYNLMRRDQGRSHIEGGSVLFADYKNRRGVNVTDQGGAMSPDEVEAALSLLTKRQIEVAEKVQEFVTNKGGEWGNEISMRRFGIRSFPEKRYWPLRVDKNTLSTAVDAKGNELYRLLNKSFTKPTTPNANNQIIIGGFFDDFASHMSDMAQYHSFALPILDMLRWINYSESTTNAGGQRVDRGVKASMDAAFGKAAQDYVVKLLKDINGNKTTNGQSALAMQMLGRYNRAAVGANLRVALLQPTSVMRARLELSGARLFAGVNSPHYRRGRDEMLKWSGIAKWKDLGFFDVNVSRNLTSLVKRDKGVVDRIVDKSMWLAEKGDRMTWVAIWNACRSEVAKESKLKEGSDEFFREVAKRFENVVYRTQVVDSVLTKSNYMRRDDFVSKTTSSFMSEPTLTYNTLLSVRNRLSDDARKHGKGESWKRNRRYAVRALATYITSQAATSFIQALVAIERDDDDEYLTFLERLREEFGEAMEDNFNMAGSVPLSVLGDIPIFSQLYEGVKRVMAAFGADTYGFEPYSGMFEIFDDLVSVGKIVKDRKEGSSRYTEYAVLYRSLSILSSFVGLPISGATREAISAYNLAAQIYNEYIGPTQGNKLKIVRQYDAGDTDRVKYAYQDGYLTEEEAVMALQEDAGLSEGDAITKVNSWDLASVKEAFKSGELDEEDLETALHEEAGLSEDDAYWKAQELAGGENYRKYDEFYVAVETGSNLKSVVKTYLDNGVKKETLASQITEHFKPIYVELYKANKASSLMGYLLNAYEILGYKREDKKKDILDWPEQARKKEEEEKKKK